MTRPTPAIGAIAIDSGGVTGLSLGLVGGGGSILAVPLLAHVVGVAPAHIAIGTSALAVALNAFANLLGQRAPGTCEMALRHGLRRRDFHRRRLHDGPRGWAPAKLKHEQDHPEHQERQEHRLRHDQRHRLATNGRHRLQRGLHAERRDRGDEKPA